MTTSPTVNCAELHEQMAAERGPRLVDVRTPGEFETAHIPGAYNVPLDLLREHRDEIARHLDDGVVLVCRSGQRAATAGATLHDVGLTNIRILAGGMTAWQDKGFDVRRGVPRWDLERQVRLVAGTVVAASVFGSVARPQLKWVAAAIGAGLTTAALTDTCAMGMLLARLPYNRGPVCDPEALVARLADRRKGA